ncbi:hypothetical protein RQM47_00015 [Rubrivirga sp. S365]|uniref:hypothetical protein n=1 Tax=Rubrivirga sp. S365 TaxID=3076080 RepID=UPI0028C7C40E|nr:hypothetical protein [Rubrivirga sp. S365]MDT7855019.1 hypothetical protein [Rubrivirga sp. S365]
MSRRPARRAAWGGAALLALALAAPPRAQIAVGADVSVGPSVTALGTRGVVRAGGVALPLGEVSFPTSVGVDARVRVEVRGPSLGGRFGVGYLSASDVFDGASLLNQRGLDLQFLLASAELTLRQPFQGGTLLVGVGPEARALVGGGGGLTRYLGDVRDGHLALGASVGARFAVGGVVVGPEVRAGLALTPFSDGTITALGGAVELDGSFRFDHLSASVTVGL